MNKRLILLMTGVACLSPFSFGSNKLVDKAKNIKSSADVAEVFSRVINISSVDVPSIFTSSNIDVVLPSLKVSNTESELLNENLRLAAELVKNVRKILLGQETATEFIQKIFGELLDTTDNGFYNVSKACIRGFCREEDARRSLDEKVDSAWHALWQARDLLDLKMAQLGYWAAVSDLENRVQKSSFLEDLAQSKLPDLLFGWKCLAEEDQIRGSYSADSEGTPLTKIQEDSLIEGYSDSFKKVL